MKKIVIISWKKLITFCLSGILIGGIVFLSASFLGNIAIINVNIVNDPYKTYSESSKSTNGSLEEFYIDIFMTLLAPYINEAVTSYYEKNTGYSPTVDPWNFDTIYIERPIGYRAFRFIIKLEISPYLGAHNSIGIDHITLGVTSLGEIKIIKFEHIKDYPIPPWLQ